MMAAMTDVATGFMQAVSAFAASRLGRTSATSFKDAGSLMASLADGVPGTTKPAFDRLRADIEANVDLVKPIVAKIDQQTAVIKKMANESTADAAIAPFTAMLAGRIATRVGTAVLAIDEAVSIVATELAKNAAGDVDTVLRDQLMGIWNPWAQPFKDLGDGAGKIVDSLGKQVLGLDGASGDLAEVVKFDPVKFRLSATLAASGQRNFGAFRLNETTLEAFLGFARREFVNPSEAQKLELVERAGKWWRADDAVLGVRVFTKVEPGLQQDPLLKAIMPGSSKEPKAITPTAITLDTTDGLSLGDGQGSGNERMVLPIQFNFPGVEIREVALGIVRSKAPAREVTGLEVTTVIAAKLGDAVGMQIGGAGAVIHLDGAPNPAAMFPWAVGPRWPDAVGLRIKTGPVNGGGYLERKVRTYGSGDDKQEIVEFGGVLQVEILKVGVFAIGILSPDPFSMVLVMGVRFPTAIELSWGFTFNGVGGILAINRTVDSAKLIESMKTHFIDKVLFPEDPVAEAPSILNKVAAVFPPAQGGFVVGPVVELGWGSQAKIVEAKIGVVLALPDPKIILLGSVRVRAPSKLTPVTDFRCEVYGEITGDRLLIIATLRDSKIAGIAVSGDLGLLIQWGGGGDFSLSVGGFNPRYTAAPAALKSLERLTIDLSPPAVVKIIVKVYFAVTAGAVMAGVRGDFKADVGVAKAHAWVQLDMIFWWVPRFGFAVDLDLGINIEVFGFSFAKIQFKGSLEGTTPWKVQGTATIDVWFMPTFDFELGPVTWGGSAPPIAATRDPLSIASAALSSVEAWKAVMPLDGDVLVVLARVGDLGLVAHPLASLEVTQSQVPLETHIDRIGSATVTAHRVHMGHPTTSAGPAGAVSTVKAPFAPGQFLTLTGEQLLARAGFDDLPSGCRIGAGTIPKVGTSTSDAVNWHTYFSGVDTGSANGVLDLTMFVDVFVSHSLVGRAVVDTSNPYMKRQDTVDPHPERGPAVLPAGASIVRLVDDGAAVLTDLGVLNAAEAGRLADLVTASGLAQVTAVAVGAGVM